MRKFITTVLILAVMLTMAPVYSESTQDRERAMDILWGAYTKLQQGDLTAINGIEKALKIAPNFAYANIVRAKYAMASENWDSARIFYEKGLKHLHEPDQPLSPAPSIKITTKEVEGDARVFLGYTYVKLAQRANTEGKTRLEKEHLGAAKKNLQKSLTLEPGREEKAMAERLLSMFR